MACCWASSNLYAMSASRPQLLRTPEAASIRATAPLSSSFERTGPAVGGSEGKAIHVEALPAVAVGDQPAMSLPLPSRSATPTDRGGQAASRRCPQCRACSGARSSASGSSNCQQCGGRRQTQPRSRPAVRAGGRELGRRGNAISGQSTRHGPRRGSSAPYWTVVSRRRTAALSISC